MLLYSLLKYFERKAGPTLTFYTIFHKCPLWIFRKKGRVWPSCRSITELERLSWVMFFMDMTTFQQNWKSYCFKVWWCQETNEYWTLCNINALVLHDFMHTTCLKVYCLDSLGNQLYPKEWQRCPYCYMYRIIRLF